MADTADNTDEQIRNGSVTAFLTQLAFTGGFLLIFFSLFIILRPRKRYDNTYRPRRKLAPDEETPDLPSGYLSWIVKLIRIPESTVTVCTGYDTTVYLRLAKLGVMFFAFTSIYGFCVLIPVYVTQCGDTCQAGLNRLSMANVESESPALLASMFSVWINSLFAYWMLHRAYREFQQLRIHYLMQKRPEAYSVLIQEMPREDASDDALTKLFNFTSNGNVNYAVTHKNTKELQKAYDRRDFYVRKLERAVWDFNHSPNRERPMHKTKFLGLCGDKVDSIEFYTQKLEKYNAKVAELRAGEMHNARSGFVTFKNVCSAATAPQIMYDNNTLDYQIKAAPAPDDVYWPNMNIYGYDFLIRRIIVIALTIFLVFFYMIPVTFVQGFCNMETLQSIFGESFVNWINSVPGVQALLTSILPTLALTIFSILLIPICYWLSVAEGWKAMSTIEQEELKKYYLFQLFNIFLITAFGSSILNQLNTIIDDPGSIVDSLAVGLPASSNFFINYVMLLAFGGWGAALLRLVPLIIIFIKLRWLAKTPREQADAINPGAYSYPVAYATDLLVWALGFTYSTMAPIILPFVIAYFCFAWFVAKYQFLYVNVPVYESGGKYFGIVFNRILVGMFVYQLMMWGIFGLKKSYISFLLLPLPFLTVLFWWLEHKMYRGPSEYMPIKLAAEFDKANEESAAGEEVAGSIERHAYVQECLKAKPAVPETWPELTGHKDPEVGHTAVPQDSAADGSGIQVVDPHRMEHSYAGKKPQPESRPLDV